MDKKEEQEFKELVDYNSNVVLEILLSGKGMLEEDVKHLWFNSKTYKTLQKEETNMWKNSPQQLVKILLEELRSKINIESDLDGTIQICATFFKDDVWYFNLDKNRKYRAEVKLSDTEIKERVYFEINLTEIETGHTMMYNKTIINRIAVDTPDKFFEFAESEIEYAISNNRIQNALNYLDKEFE